MRRNICIAHLVNSSRDSNELKLFEPSRPDEARRASFERGTRGHPCDERT